MGYDIAYVTGAVVRGHRLEPTVVRALLESGGDVAHAGTSISPESMRVALEFKVPAKSQLGLASLVNDPASAEMLLLARPRRKAVAEELLRRFAFSDEVLGRFLKVACDADLADLILSRRVSVDVLMALRGRASSHALLWHVLRRADELDDDTVFALLRDVARSTVCAPLLALFVARPGVLERAVRDGFVAAALCAPSPEVFTGVDVGLFADFGRPLLENPALPMPWRKQLFSGMSGLASAAHCTHPDTWPVVDFTVPVPRQLALQLLSRDSGMSVGSILTQTFRLGAAVEAADDVRARAFARLRDQEVLNALRAYPQVLEVFPALADRLAPVAAPSGFVRVDRSKLVVNRPMLLSETPVASTSTPSGCVRMGRWDTSTGMYPFFLAQLGDDLTAWKLLFQLLPSMMNESLADIAATVKATLA